MTQEMTLKEETERRVELLKQSIILLKEEIEAKRLSINRIEDLIKKLEKNA